MKDYRCVSVGEAVQEEVTIKFIEALKMMDTQVALRRICAILNSTGDTESFLGLAAKFNSVVNTKTSADGE